MKYNSLQIDMVHNTSSKNSLIGYTIVLLHVIPIQITMPPLLIDYEQ